VLGYWFPANGNGPVASDAVTIPRSSRSPVLAHLFLNFMLDMPNALANTRGTGFMQPLNGMTPTRLIREGAVPPSLISTVVLENAYYRGLKELALPAAADALWHQAWQSVESHMQLSPIR
jgi:spermidine/putrescine-binding protein